MDKKKEEVYQHLIRHTAKQLQQRGAQSVRDVYLLMLNDAGQIYFAAKEPI